MAGNKFINSIRNKAADIIKPKAAQVAPASKEHADLRNFVSRLDWGRIRADVRVIMDSIAEAERAFSPQRVKMQKVYDNTVLNDQVWTCMERRKDLTLLRKYELYDPATNEPDKIWSDYIQAQCFKLLNNYALDGVWYGYNLISLGDIVNGLFPSLGIVSRRNISPDRHTVSSMEYGVTGSDFLAPEWAPWHVWVATPSENGRSPVGYGLLLRIALIEVLARGNRSRNADYNEVFGAPFRVGYTNKQDEGEREDFFNMLVRMGGLGAVLLDSSDDEKVNFHETNTGTGFQTYANFEDRLYKGISKLSLGHGDAVDSVPGKLGAGQGDDNPVTVALRSKQTKDGAMIEALWNDQVLPSLRQIGIKIPINLRYRFLNDAERAEIRAAEDESNRKTAEVMKTIKDAGGVPDWAYFKERTGMDVKEAPQGSPALGLPAEPSKQLTARMRNALNKLYNTHKH